MECSVKFFEKRLLFQNYYYLNKILLLIDRVF
jgi:hypothetical protein